MEVGSIQGTKHVFILSNDSFEGEPEEKRRKTTNVVIEQPATDSKVLIDNVPDNSNLLEEVSEQKCWDTFVTQVFVKLQSLKPGTHQATLKQ